MQKQKIKQYVQAIRMIKQGKTQIQACETAGISRMTFNKYREQFGEEISPNLLEVLPPESKPVTKQDAPVVAESSGSDLERLLAENAALAEQLKLRAELAKFMH